MLAWALYDAAGLPPGHPEDATMLRTALIGYPSTGKTTLFRLMTEAHEAPRAAHGRLEATLGIARVPDPRLDVLTAMYNPRKRVPATVEFADIPGRPSGTGADALLDVAAYRNADALVHVVRAFPDPAIPHAAGSVDPRRDARAMEDELILADLAVVEKRLERLAKDLKKTRTADLEREQEILLRCKPHLENGAPLRVLELGADDRRRLRGFQFLSAKPLLLVLNVDEGDLARRARRPARAARSGGTRRRARRRAPWSLCAKIELEIAQLEPADAAAFLADLGLDRVGARSRHPRELRTARLHLVLHGRRGRVPRVVHPARHAGAGRRRGDSHGPLARVHPRRGGGVRPPGRPRLDGGMPRTRRGAARRQGVHRPGRRYHQRPVRDVIR